MINKKKEEKISGNHTLQRHHQQWHCNNKKKKYTAVNNGKTLTDVNLGECSEFTFQCQHNPRHCIYKKSGSEHFK